MGINAEVWLQLGRHPGAAHLLLDAPAAALASMLAPSRMISSPTVRPTGAFVRRAEGREVLVDTIFSQLTGHSITGHRNLIHISYALDRLRQGELDLARLAVELGFADHAHLTRTLHYREDPEPVAGCCTRCAVLSR